MSDGAGSRKWTILVLGQEGGRAFRRVVTTRWIAAVVGGAACVVLGAGAGLGWAWARSQESDRVTRLQQQVTELQRERERVDVLASRLDSISGAYRNLQRIMSGEVAASERDIQLPPAAPAERVAADARDRRSWSWPLARKGFVTRTHGTGPGEFRGHPGLDIAVPTGSYVLAAQAGTVLETSRDSVYGRFLRVEHGDGHVTLYGHNRWIFVSAGDSVEQGEVLALSGSSGRSTAPHLHFEIARGGTPVDPLELFGDEIPARRVPDGSEGRR